MVENHHLIGSSDPTTSFISQLLPGWSRQFLKYFLVVFFSFSAAVVVRFHFILIIQFCSERKVLKKSIFSAIQIISFQ